MFPLGDRNRYNRREESPLIESGSLIPNPPEQVGNVAYRASCLLSPSSSASPSPSVQGQWSPPLGNAYSSPGQYYGQTPNSCQPQGQGSPPLGNTYSSPGQYYGQMPNSSQPWGQAPPRPGNAYNGPGQYYGQMPNNCQSQGQGSPPLSNAYNSPGQYYGQMPNNCQSQGQGSPPLSNAYNSPGQYSGQMPNSSQPWGQAPSRPGNAYNGPGQYYGQMPNNCQSQGQGSPPLSNTYSSPGQYYGQIPNSSQPWGQVSPPPSNAYNSPGQYFGQTPNNTQPAKPNTGNTWNSGQQTPGSTGSPQQNSVQQAPATETTPPKRTFSTNVPDHTIGFHQLYPPNEESGGDAQVDIIAIHGLAEDAYSAWTETKSGKLWLRDFLPQYLLSHKITSRIMTFGYQSGVFTQDAYENSGRLHTFSEQLLNHLADSDRTSPDGFYRPILFICHSLGGLVIKASLNLAFSKASQYSGIVESTKSIMFLGTPHAGSDLSVWARLLGRLSAGLELNASSAGDFKTWSGTLMDLATNFVDRAPKLKITTFFETKALGDNIIVDEGSARMNLPNERTVPLSGDHLSICKFAKPDENAASTVMKRIVRTVEEIVKEAAAEKAAIEKAAAEKAAAEKAAQEKARSQAAELPTTPL